MKDWSRRLLRPIAGLVLALGIASAGTPAPEARAQSTQQRFHDLFVTAGYTTAFGAAIGTAFLAWTPDPAANLRYVAMGASLGFIGGSIMGSYVIFSPMVADNSEPNPGGTLLSSAPLPDEGVVVRPTWDREDDRVASIEGGMTLMSF